MDSNNESIVLELLAPQLLYGILMAANGNMPSNVLEEIVNSFRNLWMATSDELMQSVLRRIMTINTFPSVKTKEKTKELFVVQIICDECRRSKARFKKLLKAFCGGKKKREKMRAASLQKKQLEQQLKQLSEPRKAKDSHLAMTSKLGLPRSTLEATYKVKFHQRRGVIALYGR